MTGHTFTRRTSVGTVRRTGAGVTIYGGADWDATNRLLSAVGGGYRGNAAGHTIAYLIRIDAQAINFMIADSLDGTGKGWDLRQDTATTIRWRNANAAGNNWYASAAYSPAADIGKLVLLVMVYSGPGGWLSAWANDEKVGADVAVDGYTQPTATQREAIACRLNGTFAHTGLRWFGRGCWDRAFNDTEVHALYDSVAATGKIPEGLVNEASILNVTDDAVAPDFPATVTNQVTPGTGNFTFVTGTASGVTLVSETI